MTNDQDIKRMTFLEIAQEILKDSDSALTHRQIWYKAVEKGLDKNLRGNGQTPINSMAAQLSVNVRKSTSLFVIASRQPIMYWLRSRGTPPKVKDTIADEIPSEAGAKSTNTKQGRFSERALHPLLVRFIDDEFDAYAKTIFHEESKKSKKGQAKWIHPDIVGVHFPFSDYDQATLDLSRELKMSRCIIYAFELKIALSFENLKESYFQAVSNSSFANEGYLVIFDEIDPEVLDEIKRLRDSFGIGLIKLDIDPLQSRVIFPAQPRELDLKTIDLLAGKNKKFKEFIINVAKDMNIADKERIAKQHYDEILGEEDLEKYMKKEKIVNG